MPAKIKEYEPDEVAMLFPLMEGAPYEQMKADVAERGFTDPGTVVGGKLLDGRNRQRIALDLGIPFPVVQYDGDDSAMGKLQFVISKNLHRRHLNAGQRAGLAARSTALVEKLRAEAAERKRTARSKDKGDDPEKIPGDQEQGETREKLAAAFDVNPHYVSDLIRLDRESPELVDEIIANRKTISQVKHDLREQEQAGERHQQNRRIKIGATPDAIKSVNRYRLIIVGTSWIRELGKDWLESMGTDRPLEEYADEDCLVLMLTGGNAETGHRCGTLLGHWGFRLAKRYFPLTGTEKHNGEPWEPVIVGYRGRVPVENIVPRAPAKCSREGIEETLLDAAREWLREHHATNLVLHFAGKRVIEGCVNWPLQGDPVAA